MIYTFLDSLQRMRDAAAELPNEGPFAIVRGEIDAALDEAQHAAARNSAMGAIVGGYKVTWRAGYLGGTLRIYIGLNDADAINAGTLTLADAIKRVVATSCGVAMDNVTLLTVKAGNKKIAV